MANETKSIKKYNPEKIADVAEVIHAAIYNKRATVYNKWLKETAFPTVQSLLGGDRKATINAWKNIYLVITNKITYTSESVSTRTWAAVKKNIVPKV